MGHLLYFSAQSVEVSGPQSYQDTLFTSTMSLFSLCPSPYLSIVISRIAPQTTTLETQ